MTIVTDRIIGDVPLPGTLPIIERTSSPFAGLWSGRWGGVLPHILIVPHVTATGEATVIYATGGNADQGFAGNWSEIKGHVSEGTLRIATEKMTAEYHMSTTGRMRGVFGEDRAFAVLDRRDIEQLSPAPDDEWWSTATSLMLDTGIVEDGNPVRLHTLLQLPAGNGPFPLAMIHHGSAGGGADMRRLVWSAEWLGDMLNERGWAVAFPQRRGRGGSDGVYGEGLTPDGTDYSGDAGRSLSGAARALDDAEAALLALRQRNDISDDPVLLMGMSRGGVLAHLQAAERPDDVAGVVNFVGGWLREGYGDHDEVHRSLFRKAAAYRSPTLWIYGEDDPLYTVAYSRAIFDYYLRAGGQGRFMSVEVPGEEAGHYAMFCPPRWADDLAAYLDQIAAGPNRG
ncbi:MAG: alpha/beta hydrolase [Pseudomonadota bacterium]